MLDITAKSISLFAARMQKTLQDYFNKEVNVQEAEKIFAEVVGLGSEHDLPTILQKNQSDNWIPVYVCLDKEWLESQCFDSVFNLSSRSPVIQALYSQKTYDILGGKNQIKNCVILEARVDFEKLVASANASIFGHKNNFDLRVINKVLMKP